MRGIPSARHLLVCLSASLAACGGGGSGGTPSPPPLQPDFSITLSSSSVNISQGSASSPVAVAITPQNGFSSSVQLSFSGLPTGVTTNPASPFSLSPGQNVSVLFGAVSNAATGQFNVVAQGTSGALSHSQPLTLAVQSVAQANLPQTAYAENDSVASLDNPPGSPWTRHIVCDSANQRFYVANAAMNRVEVFAASSATLLSTIDAPAASSVDLSSDGSTLWVGTNTEQILAISTSSLRVTSRYPVAGLTPIPGTVFIRPIEVIALSSDQALVRLRQAASTESLLALWNPSSNTFTDLTSSAPAVFQNGAGVLARSADHTHVLVAANDSSGEVAIFNANGNVLAGPQAALAGSISVAAANSTGTKFAIAVTAGGTSQVLLLDSKLNTLATYATPGVSGLVFSTDGQSLYVAEPYGNSSVLSILSTTNLQRTGQVPDIIVQGVSTRVEELGPPPFVYGLNNRGVALTPDHKQLLVADFGAQNVYLINPDGAAYNGTAVKVGGVAGFSASGPSRLAATSTQTVFVGLSGEGTSAGSCNNCLGQMNLLASPPSFQPAPQPEVTTLTGSPLLQSDLAGDTAYLAYASSPGGPVGSWSASTPNAFSISTAQDLATDQTTASDGTVFAVRAQITTEIRQQNLTFVSNSTAPEIETIPNRVAVPGIALHPSGALLYEPFLDGPPPAAPPAAGIHGGVDIRDAHNGQLRLRVYLPEPFAMLNTDVDGLHGQFLTIDENGQRLFALTTNGLSIVQLSHVPLGIGTLNPATGSAAGGTTVTLRGSGFQSGITATLGGKSAAVTFTDMNTLTITTPQTSTGAQQLILTNPDGESVSLDAAFLAQ